MNVWLEVLGRAHPALLHTPFGVLAALVLLELWARRRGAPLDVQTRGLLVGLLALSSLAAAGSGWFLGEQPDYTGERLELHRKLGIAVAACSALMAVACWRAWGRVYALALTACAVLMAIAGHHGGTMTHGEDFLFEPLRRAETTRSPEGTAKPGDAVSAALDPAALLATQAQAALIARCGSCHGASKQRAGLALHDREALLAGARSGAVVVAGDPEASELVRRLRLPPDDRKHMPPSSKPQLEAGEIDALVAWVAAGLPLAASTVKLSANKAQLDAAASLVEASSTAAPSTAAAPDAAPSSAAPSPAASSTVAPWSAAERAALAALASRQVHAELLDPTRGSVWVDFRARPETDDTEVAELVAQLGPRLDEVSLRGTAISDAALSSLSEAPALRRLDLAGTAISATGLAALRACSTLESLDLSSSSVDDAAIAALTQLSTLRSVYVWNSSLSAEGVAELRAARPELHVADGSDLFAEALEVEPELALSEVLVAVNRLCPVTGDPIDPLLTREHAGELVGFCCTSCPATFLADPEAFPITRAGPLLGDGAHVYEWETDWLQLPAGQAELGNTHGEIVVDRAGNLHLNTDTEQAIMSFAPDGSFLRSWGAEFANGLHGMQLVEEGDEEFLYFVHFGRHEFLKATLLGEIVWRMGVPEESGKYASAEQFKPTSIAVAPNGSFFVADGYGEGWVHQYDAERRWLRAIGGPGTEPGRFQTPHGVWVDTRAEQPELLVADRENHRLQRFDMQGAWLGSIEGMLRRPCKIQQRGEFLVVPDLAGRVTILDGANELVAQLGDNPDPSRRANNGVPREDWLDGEFLAPHSATWDAAGNLYVMDWNRHGRITKLRRVVR